MKRIDKALERQIDRNRSKNILYSQLDQIIEIDPDFLAALEELLARDRRGLADSALEEAISFATRMLLQRLYSINQFLQIEERDEQQLKSIYRRTWRKIIETRNIEAALKEYHYPALTQWISNSYPKSFVKPLAASPKIGHVVCEEYSPQLQLDLLRIDLQTIKQPLLDLGCGPLAHLVRHLRARGIEAHGIDRRIGNPERFLQQINWFDYAFQPNTWGTITSNMAFTNHLLYAYHHDPTQLERYRTKFKEIIASLMIGGSFHYAPSVPFIEQELKRGTYHVERATVIGDVSMTKITRLADAAPVQRKKMSGRRPLTSKARS